ncbi:attachment protein [Providencia rettgeri]|uniref:attachment protein n=1 Tax=Providencia rettgeri TaxID=587 RepID=UPI002361E604|nr:attachment protein [Providencia rettgeri]
MKFYFLFFFVSMTANATDWISISKSTYRDSVVSESKAIKNPDGSSGYIYFIDNEMKLSACEGAKKSANSVFKDMIPIFEMQYPKSEFRLNFDEDCTYNDVPSEKLNVWSLTAFIVGDMQRSTIDSDSPSTNECEIKPNITGSFKNIYLINGERIIYYDGCEYEATGVIVCIGDNECSADWVPTGNISDESYKPSIPSEDDNNEEGENGGDDGSNEGNGGNNGGGNDSNNSLSKEDITESVESGIKNATPNLSKSIRSELTEHYDSAIDESNANKQLQLSTSEISDSIDNLIRGVGRIANPDGYYGEGDSVFDSASRLAAVQFGLNSDDNGAVWEAFINPNSLFPQLPNGNGCHDFKIYEYNGEQLVISCDILLKIKMVLAWIMYSLTFWYVFSSATSLLRKES